MRPIRASGPKAPSLLPLHKGTTRGHMLDHKKSKLKFPGEKDPSSRRLADLPEATQDPDKRILNDGFFF